MGQGEVGMKAEWSCQGLMLSQSQVGRFKDLDNIMFKANSFSN